METLNRHAVLCFSGGMDSTSLLYHLLAEGYQVTSLSFNYAQKHVYELKCVQWQLEYLQQHHLRVTNQTIDLREFGQGLSSALIAPDQEIPLGHYESDNMRQTVVPNRNAIFFSLAAAQALSLAESSDQPVRLSLAVHAGDHAIYPDCRPQFYQAIWKAFEIGNYDADRVELYLPYLKYDKAAVLRDAQSSIAKLGFDFDEIFSHTCTSYQPDSSGRPHGFTGSDIERILAFHELDIRDPLDYSDRWELVVERAVRIQSEQNSKQ